jgi:uncharacterized protein (UPF0262 family)
VFDLLESNTFVLPDRDGRSAPPGPYRLTLAIREKRLVFDVDTEAGTTRRSSTSRSARSGRW